LGHELKFDSKVILKVVLPALKLFKIMIDSMYRL